MTIMTADSPGLGRRIVRHSDVCDGSCSVIACSKRQARAAGEAMA